MLNKLNIQIVVPVLNDVKRLRVCVLSLAKQLEVSRIIVVDNGSTDGSAELARSLNCQTIVQKGLKVGALRNRGVEMCSGEYIVFVDSDHEVTAGWLEAGVCILEQDRTIVATGAHYLPPPDGTWVQKTWAIHRLRGEDRGDVDWLGSGNLFVRREDFLKVGGFNEELVAAEDVDLCHRLRTQLGGRIVHDSRTANIHHGEPKNLRVFFKKELWRGSSGLKAWKSQGFPLRDLPSFIWPLWHLMGTLALMGSIALSCFDYRLLPCLLTNIVLLPMPALLLSAKTCFQQRNLQSILPLGILYFVYGIARAVALLKFR